MRKLKSRGQRSAPERPAPEEGAALVIALLAVVFMTIMGVVLIRVLGGGLVQAATSEAGIQAETIAQKGLDDALAMIRRAVDQGVVTGNYRESVRGVQAMLDIASQSLDPKPDDDNAGLVKQAQRGSYEIDILTDEVKINPEAAQPKPVTNPDYPYVRKFVIRSKGTIDRRPKAEAAKEMTVYVSSINPVFRYPLSTRGNLTLNGSPTIVGDVLVREGNLTVRNEAGFIGAAGTLYGFLTDFPALRGFLRVDGKAAGSFKYFKDDLESGEHLESEKLQSGYFSKYFPLEDPTLKYDQSVGIEAYVSEKSRKFDERKDGLFDKTVNQGIGQTIEGTYAETGSIKYAGQSVALSGTYTLKAKADDQIPDDFLIDEGYLIMNETGDINKPEPELNLENGSLYIRYSQSSQLVAADLRGTLSIPEDKFAFIDGDVVLNNGFYFPRGSMYINGNLRIIGDIRLEGTVYVNGNVELKEMRSINKQKNPADDPSPLIVIASKNIVLGNNTNQNNAEIRAFMYSKQNLQLYGVLSRLNITGGIHGEEDGLTGSGIELNAVRGELAGDGQGQRPKTYAGNDWTGSGIDSNQKGLEPADSRLRITYDHNLYDKPPSGIPIIDGFDVFVQQIRYVQ